MASTEDPKKKGQGQGQGGGDNLAENGQTSTRVSVLDDLNIPMVNECDTNIFSKIFFSWAKPLFTRASKLHSQNLALELDDLLPIPYTDEGDLISKAFEDEWKKLAEQGGDSGDGDGDEDEDDTSNATIAKAMKPVISGKVILAGFFRAINTALQFLFPILLNAILSFIQNSQVVALLEDGNEDDKSAETDPDPWHVTYRGYWLSALLFVVMASKAIFESWYFHLMNRAAYKARVAVSISVYNKALRLANAERQSTTLGELINLMQVDATKIEMFIPQIHVLWDGVFQTTGYMVILYNLIGWPCFAGLGIIILGVPVQGIIMKRLFGLNRFMVKYTDDRVKNTNEAVQGIRCVKMYTWEESFSNIIADSRDDELDVMRRMAYLRAASSSYMGALPGIVAVVSFIVYAVVYEGNIDAPTLFAALVAFSQLRFPLLFYPMALAQLAQASVSAKRVEAFLRLKEVRTDVDGKSFYNRTDSNLNNGDVSVDGVTIYWSDPKTPIPTKNDDKLSMDGSTHSSKSNASRGSKSSKGNKKNATITASSVPDTEMQEDVRYPEAVLSDVSMNITRGELCAVIGRVGSGKSTLCSAILNEAVIDTGSISLNGSIAYASQTAWILNATLRDNITFGLPYVKEKYDEILSACQLEHDLALLDAGDMTEIGENGINLSGGQRQRVSIARAAYSGADIVILDDPLSALDPEVGKKLFDECIVNLMKDKTRIFVTNQLQFLPQCDNIVALGEGKVLEQGTFADLSSNDGEVGKIMQDLRSKGESETDGENDDTSDKKDTKKDKADPKKVEKDKEDHLVTEEERNIGAVSWHVYKKYISSGGGWCLFLLVLILFIICTANDLLVTTWVSLWTSDANYEKYPRSFYLGYYALSCVALGFFTYFRSMGLTFFGVRASKKLHEDLLVSILRAPMSFFDTTPTGRILSRFSKDLYSVDIEIIEYLNFVIFGSMTIFVAMGAIVVVTPWFGIAVLPIGYVYMKVLNYFREVSRETKRLESISRSPVFSHFSETLGGLGTIRAYDQNARFIGEFENKVSVNTRTTYNNKIADRWLSVRLEILGSMIAGLAAVFACSVVTNGTVSVTASSTDFASVAGLSLNYAISVTSMMNWVVRCFAQLEAAMNAVERILFYSEEIPHEAPAKTEGLKLLTNGSVSPDDDKTLPPSSLAVMAKGGAESPGSEWPSKGRITLNNLKMRYRSDTPLVIKGLNIEIEGGSKVGVVGRTGSGKSSLLLALLRIVEPDLQDDTDYQAPITVDGVDVLRIGLTDLRGKVGIIPQNPTLFSGSIRSNMDPFSQHTDEDIWNAIEGCGMRKTIEEMPDLLDAPVTEYGENLSQGQRQLLCLGRALLKQCRVLMLDEATSSVDYETDKKIQQTLRQAFSECTVLTIAHRVNTILDSDKILVMVDGKVGEFASPQELLADETSIFTDIVKHSQNSD